MTRAYSSITKIIAYSTIVILWVVAAFITYMYYTRNKINSLGSNTIRINKENIIVATTSSLLNFYEWKPHQQIVQEFAWLPKKITKSTNSDGLVDNREHSVSKPPGLYRIVTIGDSFTEGALVEIEDTYPTLLEHKLNIKGLCPERTQYEVINLGVEGYDIEYAAHRYLIRGLKYNPEVVLWLLKDDDFFDINEQSFQRINRYLNELPTEVKEDITLFEKYNIIDESIKVPDVSLWSKLQNIVLKEMHAEIPEEEFIRIQVASVEKIANSSDAMVVIVTFSDTNRIYKDRLNKWALDIENLHVYTELPNPSLSGNTHEPNDGHPNAQGYRLISDGIYEHLVQIRPALCYEGR